MCSWQGNDYRYVYTVSSGWVCEAWSSAKRERERERFCQIAEGKDTVLTPPQVEKWKKKLRVPSYKYSNISKYLPLQATFTAPALRWWYGGRTGKVIWMWLGCMMYDLYLSRIMQWEWSQFKISKACQEISKCDNLMWSSVQSGDGCAHEENQSSKIFFTILDGLFEVGSWIWFNKPNYSMVWDWSEFGFEPPRFWNVESMLPGLEREGCMYLLEMIGCEIGWWMDDKNVSSMRCEETHRWMMMTRAMLQSKQTER